MSDTVKIDILQDELISFVVLVCGGRTFFEREQVSVALDAIDAERRVGCLVHGGATGADDLAREWARAKHIPIAAYPANWKTHGKQAGPIRNARMLRESKPDLVVAFPGGKGTAHMVSIARKAGVEVREIVSASGQSDSDSAEALA